MKNIILLKINKKLSDSDNFFDGEIKVLNKMTSNTINVGDIILIPHKQKWTGDMIRKIMTDETQIGTLVQGKTERTSFKNHKPI